MVDITSDRERTKKAVLKARQEGLQQSLETQLKLFAEGEITAEELTQRKSAMEGDYLTWYKRFSRYGPTSQERKDITDAASQRLQAESQAQTEYLLEEMAEGRISERQLSAGTALIEESHLDKYRMIEAGKTPYEDPGLRYAYEFPRAPKSERILVDAELKDVDRPTVYGPVSGGPPSDYSLLDFQNYEPTEKYLSERRDRAVAGFYRRSDWADIVDASMARISGEEPIKTEPLMRFSPTPRDDPVEWVEGDLTQEEVEFLTPPKTKWTPTREIMEPPEFLMGPERFFGAITDPLSKSADKFVGSAQVKAKEGDPLGGFGDYAVYLGARTVRGVVEGASFFVRPVAWYRTLQTVASIPDPQVRAQIASTVAQDPVGFLFEVSGGIAGGMGVGKLANWAKTQLRGGPEMEITTLRGLDVSDESARGLTLNPRLKTTKLSPQEAAILDDIISSERADTVIGITRGKYGRQPVWLELGPKSIDDLLSGKPLETEGALVKVGLEEAIDDLDVLQPLKSNLPDELDFKNLEGRSIMGDKSPLTYEYLTDRFGIAKGRGTVDDLVKLSPVDEYKETGVFSRWDLEGEGVYSKFDTDVDIVGLTSKANRDEFLESFFKIEPEPGPGTPFSKHFTPEYYPDKAAQKAAMDAFRRSMGSADPIVNLRMFSRSIFGPPTRVTAVRSSSGAGYLGGGSFSIFEPIISSREDLENFVGSMRSSRQRGGQKVTDRPDYDIFFKQKTTPVPVTDEDVIPDIPDPLERKRPRRPREDPFLRSFFSAPPVERIVPDMVDRQKHFPVPRQDVMFFEDLLQPQPQRTVQPQPMIFDGVPHMKAPRLTREERRRLRRGGPVSTGDWLFYHKSVSPTFFVGSRRSRSL